MNLYNIIEKDWNIDGKISYHVQIRTDISALGVPINDGWNLPLEIWEIGQILGGS